MPSSVNTAPNPATNAIAWRTAAQRDGSLGRSLGGDRDGRQLAEVGRHERQHARREERDQAGGDRHEERVVARHRPGAPSRTSSRKRREPGRARRQLQLPVAQGHDRDREGVPAMPVVVGLDVALHDRRRRQAAGGAVGEQQVERRAGVLAQVAAGAAVQDEVGEGSGHGTGL